MYSRVHTVCPTGIVRDGTGRGSVREQSPWDTLYMYTHIRNMTLLHYFLSALETLLLRFVYWQTHTCTSLAKLTKLVV